MKPEFFRLGEIVAVDDDNGPIVDLHGVSVEGKELAHRMAAVKMSNGEVREYLLVSLCKIID